MHQGRSGFLNEARLRISIYISLQLADFLQLNAATAPTFVGYHFPIAFQ
jgi:hypothetical protein